MRPVNLIPPEQRRGDRAPLRTGFASYAVVAGLVVILAMVTSLVLTSNDMADTEAEKVELEARKAAAQQQAAELAPYAEFASLQQTRRQTVASLAQSRFDWERVLQELAIVLPEDVWLMKMAGTVTPEVQTENSPAVPLRASIPGPALELLGCGATHDSVARFVTALEDIDGVTRVGLDEAKRPDLSTSDPVADEGVQDDCRTRDAIARFSIVAAFDAAAVPPVTAGAPPAEAAPAPESPSGEETTVTQESEAAREAQNEDVSEARQATEIVGAIR